MSSLTGGLIPIGGNSLSIPVTSKFDLDIDDKDLEDLLGLGDEDNHRTKRKIKRKKGITFLHYAKIIVNLIFI